MYILITMTIPLDYIAHIAHVTQAKEVGTRPRNYNFYHHKCRLPKTATTNMDFTKSQFITIAH